MADRISTPPARRPLFFKQESVKLEAQTTQVDDGHEGLEAGRLRYRPAIRVGANRVRLAIAAFALFLVCTAGTAGYWLLGGGHWSLGDCAWMVLITVTTVGYGEALPVSESAQARLFTAGLLIMGLGTALYFVSALTAFIIEGDLREVIWRRRMEKRLEKLSDHYVVCGADRTGRLIVEEIVKSGVKVVVVEREPGRLDRLLEIHGDAVFAIQGDATDEGVLRDAGVPRARGLVSALQLDQDNLFVAMSARALNAALRIISRASNDRAVPKLQQVGADVVISPVLIGARRMAQELLRPRVVGFLDVIGKDLERNFDIEEVDIPPGSALDDVTLATSKIRQVSNALVLGVIDAGKYSYNPPPDFALRAGMTLIVLGERDQLDKLTRYVAG
jgi:voltage-gated potassium channel